MKRQRSHIGHNGLLISAMVCLFANSLPACPPPPCPPCHVWVSPNCVYQCASSRCEECTSGSCRVCGGREKEVCCGTSIPGYRECCREENCYRCKDDRCQYSCKSELCQECVKNQCLKCGGRQYEDCCDGFCYDSTSYECCNQGNGHICPKGQQCCGNTCCDPNPPVCKICNGEGSCTFKCDESHNPIVYGTFEGQTKSVIEPFIKKLEETIESIKAVDIDADISFNFVGELSYQEKCCSPCDDASTPTIWGSGGFELGIEIEWDVLNFPDVQIDKEFFGKGSVRGNLEFDLEPAISASGSGGVEGIFIGCDAPCWNAYGGISASLGGQLEAEAELRVETRTGWEWFDGLMTFSVEAEGVMGISVGASAGGLYYASAAGNCEQSGSGFEMGCLSLGEGTFAGEVGFDIKGNTYSIGFEVSLWDGWDNGKCG